ncbi:UDP-sugar transporter protein SLC35A5 [Engraulis encrasicolus]|uniref:UDP-sugar transporter protein SLC35A5 n=1 Tax=Engraulis encrasicolus TaxID=184585 RepID=UPI002FD36426
MAPYSYSSLSASRSCSSCCPQACRCSRTSICTLGLGLGFVILGTSRILLLKFAANADNKYDFLPASVNLLAEAIKLVFCLIMALRVVIREGRPFSELCCSSGSSLLGFLKWSVPAFLYFLDNLIIFYVMTYLQPAMAVLFSNVVILTTAVLFRLVLKRRLSWVQWAALIILFLSIVALTMGTGGSQHAIAMPGLHVAPLSPPSNSCLAFTHHLMELRNHNISASSGVESGSGSDWLDGLPEPAWSEPVVRQLRRFGVGYVLLLAQCFISSMANIYNEKILKEGDQLTESIYIQNTKLYLFGTLFNALALALRPEDRALIRHCGLLHGHNPFSACLVLATAALGLSVAFILKFRDNMFHVLTGQITTVLVTALSLFLFDFRPSADFFLQAPVVLLAIFVYHASRAPAGGDPDYALQMERLGVLNGDVRERCRGDGEELVRLKPNTDSDSEESSF